MNAKIKDHLTAYANANGYDTTDDGLMNILLDTYDYVFEEITGSHRWYEDKFVVVEIDGMLIGFDTFHTTGDNNWRDMDLEHDINSVCEVVKKEVTTTVYEPVKEEAKASA